MPNRQLELLAERLLRGGISPGVVRRYIGELTDHYEDLLRDARATGVSDEAAQRDAVSRLGASEDLAQAMLARGDLKSFAARYPAFAFGIAPPLVLVICAIAAVMVPMSLVVALKPPQPETYLAPDWLRAFARVWLDLVMYVLPPLVAAGIAVCGLRQRMGWRWIALAICAVGFIGGFYDISIHLPTAPGERGELSAGLGIMAPYPDLPENYLRTLLNIILVGLPVLWWHRRHAITATLRPD